MKNNIPLLIVLTPVFNEAWILPAFLKATSLWADYIIIADQMSTDGSRELYAQFKSDRCKLLVVDNPRKKMHMAATRRLLLEEARSLLNGNTNAILFAIDADEFLYGDFILTKEWQTILNSKPNDCFCWRWMDMQIGSKTKYKLSPYLYFAVHVSEMLWDGDFPDVSIHEMRLPWPVCAHEYTLSTFFSIHFAQISVMRRKNKSRFYQVSSVADKKRYNAINLYRQYHQDEYAEWLKMPDDAYTFYEKRGLYIIEQMNLSDEGRHFTDIIKKYIQTNGADAYVMIDIWDEDWCKRNNITKPNRNLYQSLLMWYLKKTNPSAKSLVVRAIDKILKKIIH